MWPTTARTTVVIDHTAARRRRQRIIQPGCSTADEDDQ